MQRNNQYNRRPQSHSSRSKPISYFIHGGALLAVFLFSVAFLGNILSAISPQTFSQQVFSFSTPAHLEYHCGDSSPFKDEGSGLFSNVCELVQKKISEKNQWWALPSSIKDCRTVTILTILPSEIKLN